VPATAAGGLQKKPAVQSSKEDAHVPFATSLADANLLWHVVLVLADEVVLGVLSDPATRDTFYTNLPLEDDGMPTPTLDPPLEGTFDFLLNISTIMQRTGEMDPPQGSNGSILTDLGHLLPALLKNEEGDSNSDEEGGLGTFLEPYYAPSRLQTAFANACLAQYNRQGSEDGRKGHSDIAGVFVNMGEIVQDRPGLRWLQELLFQRIPDPDDPFRLGEVPASVSADVALNYQRKLDELKEKLTSLRRQESVERAGLPGLEEAEDSTAASFVTAQGAASEKRSQVSVVADEINMTAAKIEWFKAALGNAAQSTIQPTSAPVTPSGVTLKSKADAVAAAFGLGSSLSFSEIGKQACHKAALTGEGSIASRLEQLLQIVKSVERICITLEIPRSDPTIESVWSKMLSDSGVAAHCDGMAATVANLAEQLGIE
jgi:hypothetical protein